TLRTLTVACVALLLLTTTPLEQLTRGLLGLGIPRIVVQLLSMSVRYVYVLGTELKRLRIALRTRGYRQSVTRYSYQTTACVIGSLVVRSQERAERIAQAMYCRGFSGEWRLLPVATQHTRDAAMALVMVLSLVLLPWIIAVSYQRL
ncbi:MAG: energy-coupling factor transporter transmembrane component T, partial [Gemmatales bacterium]|nr:energy-coupling factor transporter transmembrane protein EcfT [Gemmatales bacterium]MDW8175417.1 energy-coupling factor transporter transmembrane component T [Gemmatales bacterium]